MDLFAGHGSAQQRFGSLPDRFVRMAGKPIAVRGAQDGGHLRLVRDPIEQNAGPLLAADQDLQNRTVQFRALLGPALQQQIRYAIVTKAPHRFDRRQLNFQRRLRRE